MKTRLHIHNALVTDIKCQQACATSGLDLSIRSSMRFWIINVVLGNTERTEIGSGADHVIHVRIYLPAYQ